MWKYVPEILFFKVKLCSLFFYLLYNFVISFSMVHHLPPHLKDNNHTYCKYIWCFVKFLDGYVSFLCMIIIDLFGVCFTFRCMNFSYRKKRLKLIFSISFPFSSFWFLSIFLNEFKDYKFISYYVLQVFNKWFLNHTFLAINLFGPK